MGKVYLIGAGPGDLSLLTLKGFEVLKKADVVIFDRLVGEEIMANIPEQSIKINVGKSSGNHSVPQEKINDLLVEWGQKNLNVVRLKGGDPFVFGRGAEELEKLFENNIPFEVIPGITSSISAPLYAGIPVTHRDFCSSFHVIAGHTKNDGNLQIDYHSLVKLGGTLIFMMSVSSSPEIAKGLIKAGICPNTPFAFIENAARPYQRKFVGKLNEIEAVLAINNITSPSVFVVGEVCSLSDRFDWFSCKKLKSKRILVTQPKKNTSKLADSLKENGAYVTLMPMIKTSKIEDIRIDLSLFDTLIFTSSVGVSTFFDYLLDSNLDSRFLFNKKIACVGTETAKTLKNFGIIADFIPPYFDSETLAREMTKSGFVTKDSKAIILRAENGNDYIINHFFKNKIDFIDYPIYKTEKLTHDHTNISDFDIVTFTSKSCVEGFVENFKNQDLTKIISVCIGKQTEKLAKDLGFKTYISDIPTIDSILEKIIEICK